MRDYGPVIIKVCCVRSIGMSEVAAMRAFAAVDCAPEVYAFDQETCTIIMAQITSRRMLKDLFPEQDQEAVDITAELITKLHTAQPGKYPFAHIRSYLVSILNGTSTVHEQHVADLAQSWSNELLATSPGDILLHGDLHHENILFDNHRQKWVAIDPLTMIGEPAAEIGAFIRNPFAQIGQYHPLKPLLQQRIHRFSERLNIAYERAFKWSFIMAVLGVEWAAHTPQSRKDFLATAQELFELSQDPFHTRALFDEILIFVILFFKKKLTQKRFMCL